VNEIARKQWLYRPFPWARPIRSERPVTWGDTPNHLKKNEPRTHWRYESQSAALQRHLISGPSMVSSDDWTHSPDSASLHAASAFSNYTQTARLDAPCDLPPSLAVLAFSLTVGLSLYVQLYRPRWHDVGLTPMTMTRWQQQTARRRAADCEYIRLHRRRLILHAVTEPTSSSKDAAFAQCRHTLMPRCLTFTDTDMHCFIWTDNMLAKFHRNILNLSENIAKSVRGATFFWLTLYIHTHCEP